MEKNMSIVEKKEQHRRSILKAALFVFARHGFENTKLHQIAVKSKVGKGTIYNYFRDKVALYQAVVSETMEQLFHVIVARSDIVDNPLQSLTAAIIATFEFFEESPDRYVIYLRYFSDTATSSKKSKVPIVFLNLSIFEPKIRECKAKGFLKPQEAEAEDFVLSFLGIINSFLFRWFSSRKTYDFRAKIPIIAKIFSHGTYKHD